jgi:hypothetical protein
LAASAIQTGTSETQRATSDSGEGIPIKSPLDLAEDDQEIDDERALFDGDDRAYVVELRKQAEQGEALATT